VQVTLSPHGASAAEHGAKEIAISLSSMTGALNRAESQRLTTLLERMLELGNRETPSRD
jgi:hypothetical protein